MWRRLRSALPWLIGWAALAGAGAAWLASAELARLRDGFETDGRIAHRVLSQRAVQHEAVLATLALWRPDANGERIERRLSSVYPQILAIEHRPRDGRWPEGMPGPALTAAEAASRAAHRPEIAAVDLDAGRFWLVLAADPVAHALAIDLRTMVPRDEWPLPAGGPVSAALWLDGRRFVLMAGNDGDGGWTFSFRKPLAAASQPFELVATRRVGWAELPWTSIGAWIAGCALGLAALASTLRLRRDRRRAEELLRLGQVGRLNTLGELAGGIAHELNQPLTALLASTQAAVRMLDESPPEPDSARDAMLQAAGQARRAADVVGRLRRAVERPDAAGRTRAVRLDESVRNALYLLEPERRRRGVVPSVEASVPLEVSADPVALEQVIHNLITNALQALERVPGPERSLVLALASDGTQATLVVRDSGPGIAPKALPRVFEPFFSTREDGLGLGLSLCETLVSRMGGRLAARNRDPRGAEFVVCLPLAV